MKRIIITSIVLIYTLVGFHSNAQIKNLDKYDFFDSVVNNHNQIYPASGIPSAVEMILKYCKVVDFNFYDLQNEWKNKSDGSFRDFDKKEFNGVSFVQKFNLPRDENFPIDSLFNTIDNELKSGKKVIIALQVEMSWPIFVVYKKTKDGEFVSYSKHEGHTLIFRNTKEIVRKSNGTEIMTYSKSPSF